MAHASATPIIGEVNWAGSSLSSADEWLELWNDSDEPLALAGYMLRGAASTDIVFTDMHIIPPRGTFIVSNYSDTDPKCAVATTTQLVTIAVSLSNSNLKIELLTPDGALVDSVGGDSSPPAGSSLPTKTSMLRQVDGTWTSATTSTNLDPTVTDLATPGICDSCTESPPEPTVEPIMEPDPELPVIEITTSTEPIIETPSSTEPVTESQAPTSTEPVLEPLVGTSSTMETTTTSTIELPVIQAAPIVITTVVTPTSTATVIPTLDLRLSAVSPAPESGEEWIELAAPTGTAIGQAANWSLHDASGSVFKFTSNDTRVIVNGTTWRIPLASARLNNSGDTVELARPDGSIAERMVYPETPRGTIWQKGSDTWTQHPLPAPIEKTVVVETVPIITQTPVAPTVELPVIASSKQTEMTDSSIVTPETTKPKTTKAITDSDKPPTKSTTTKTTKPKTTNKKSETPPPLVTLDMLTKLEPEIRVTLEGTVGTVPGILSKNQFTIHTPDGRGLLVRGTNKQPSPEFGSRVSITGTLSLNDDGLSLRMLSKDKWTKLAGSETINPRIVDLLAPSQEDAWSLIQVTGTVLGTTGNKAQLELGGFPVTVNIKPATGYRASRLSKDDVVRITGLVDTRNEEPIIFPRNTDEIHILEHAKLMTADNKPAHWPAWTPFGAAGVTVAITEGYKRLRRLAKERKLRKLAALAQ